MKPESIVVGAGTDYPLKGLLTLPEGEPPFPAAVLVHGSGPSNMDEKIYRLTPFRDLAEGLAQRGVATLRYDKRTFAHAKKMKRSCVTVREETIEDAIRGAELLRSDSRIDSDRLFLIGHSMGAMLAPRIDAEGGGFRGMVLMAGSPCRLEEIMVRQFRQAGAQGGPMKLIARLEDRMFSRKFEGLYEMSEEEARRKKFAGPMSLWYFKEMGRKTAADYLLETEKPVLILQGGKDFQVLPSVDYAQFQELLRDRKNTEFRLYEDLNHLFVKGIYNDILKAGKEYQVEQHIGPEVLNDIAAFLLGN